MSAPTSLSELLDGLYLRRAVGIKLGLETTQALLKRLGNPERSFTAIHVAGTNGKGSVCAMLHAMLTAAGHRAALFTSPHLVRFNERFRVGNELIGDDELRDLLLEVDGHAERVAQEPGQRQPTFFEFTTAAAFTWFQRQGVEIAVLETGLGGRLDSTNVVSPLLSVITSIDRDHVDYLGEEIPAIAREKAGIIKPDCDVVCGPMSEEALLEIVRVAATRRSPVVRVEESVSVRRTKHDLTGQTLKIETESRSYPPIKVPLLGPHQVENVAVAVATAELADAIGKHAIPDEAVKEGLQQVQWPGRAQVVGDDPLVILDAAHNPAGARALGKVLDDVAKKVPCGLVAGFSKEKDVAGFFRELAGRFAACWIVPLPNEVSMPVGEAAQYARSAGLSPTIADREEAIEAAQTWAREHEGMVCIAGSVYLAGDVLEHGYGLKTERETDELGFVEGIERSDGRAGA